MTLRADSVSVGRRRVNMDSKISVVLLLAVFSCTSILAEDATFTTCPRVPEGNCLVTAVRITPCKEAPKECKLKRGSKAAISFEFTPQFSATNMTMNLYWANGAVETEFKELDNEACKYTTCPFETGKAAELNYQLKLSRLYPEGTFPIKWIVNDVADSNNVCCFITTIRLRK